MRTDFVLDALEQALYVRQPERERSVIGDKATVQLLGVSSIPGRFTTYIKYFTDFSHLFNRQ